MTRVRPGRLDDVPAITAVYNHHVAHTVATFDLVEHDPQERARTWFTAYDVAGPHRLLVVEEDGQVVGYATSGRFRAKAAYDRTVETTVYVHPDHAGRGHGSRLYDALLDAMDEEGVHLCVAAIALPSPGSVALHESFGFRPVGVLTEVGHKLGRWVDVQWWQRVSPRDPLSR